MRIWTITLTHLDFHVLDQALDAYYKTVDKIHHQHILVDHHWPIGYWEHRHNVLHIAQRYSCKVMAPYENVGAHNGYNWTIMNLPIADDDLILGFDGDSMPETKGWDTALSKVLEDPKYAAVTLFPTWNLDCKDWHDESVNGITVKHPVGRIEMINVTMWKYSFLKAANGLGGSNYYGYTEHAMFSKMNEMGLKHGYAADYRESMRPHNPQPIYDEWKRMHAGFQFLGNFHEYCKAKGVS